MDLRMENRRNRGTECRDRFLLRGTRSLSQRTSMQPIAMERSSHLLDVPFAHSGTISPSATIDLGTRG